MQIILLTPNYTKVWTIFNRFSLRSNIAPTGLSFVADAFSINIPPLRGCVSVHPRLFFYELYLREKLSEKSETL